MSNTSASDVLPMLPAAAVRPMAPEAARARLAADHGLGSGWNRAAAGDGDFFWAAASGTQPAAEPATAAEGWAQVIDIRRGIAAVRDHCRRRSDVPWGATMERNWPGVEQIAGHVEQKRRLLERKACLLEHV